MPLISAMIPVYNRSKYLIETLNSVLCQDIDATILQIVVVDDGSSEDIESVVNTLGKGRVEYYRQKQNVGQIKNFETCISLAKGDWIHILHGDDTLLFGFYERFIDVIKSQSKNEKLGAIFCRHIYMDADGDWLQISSLEQKHDGPLEDQILKICTSSIIQTPSIIVKKDVYDRIGTFDPSLGWSEDWEMWSRLACFFEVYYIKQPLARYRFHTDSTSGKNGINFSFPEETRKTQAKIIQSVPEHLRAQVKRISKIKVSISLYLILLGYKNEKFSRKLLFARKFLFHFPSFYNFMRVLKFMLGI